LLFDEKDKKIQQYFIDSAQPTIKDFDIVMETIKQSKKSLGLTDIKCNTGLHPTRVIMVLTELLEQGFIEKKRDYGRQSYVLTNKIGRIHLARYQRQLEVRERELNEMLKYGRSQLKQCLMATLRKSLGDSDVENCGQCSQCIDLQLTTTKNPIDIATVGNWLTNQIVDIDLGKSSGCELGRAVLDAKLRSPLFIEFMKNRQHALMQINPQLWHLVKNQLCSLQQQFSYTTIIIVPSRTWQQRHVFAELLAKEFNIPVYLQVLTWKNNPEHRQGECLNNDQRQRNVSQQMTAIFDKEVPTGPILLFDDYIGSGATLKEAVRALKQETRLRNKILPFSIAAVKWRLGQRGMI
jgi:ATP-dependent DNA helicase RecQ